MGADTDNSFENLFLWIFTLFEVMDSAIIIFHSIKASKLKTVFSFSHRWQGTFRRLSISQISALCRREDQISVSNFGVYI